MRLRFDRILIGLSLSLTAAVSAAPPPTEARPVTETIHGVEIVDKFRWLEGNQSEGDEFGTLTDEVVAWTDAQNSYTRTVLDNLPGRADLEKRISELMEVGQIGTPRMARDKIFFSKRTGAQAQPVIYTQTGPDGLPTKLLDPIEIDDTGLTSIGWYTPNNDGSLVAFGTARAGDENYTLNIIDTATGEWLDTEIPGKVRLAGWMPDNRSFFYSRLTDVNNPYSSTTAYHVIGRDWKEDPILVSQAEVGTIYEGLGKTDEELAKLRTTWGPYAYPSRDGRWMIIGYWTGTSGNDLWVADLDRWFNTGELVKSPIVLGEQGRNAAGVSGDQIFMQTYINAPNGKIVRVDPFNPSRENWVDIIPQRSDAIMNSFSIARGIIAVNYMVDAATRIELFDYDGDSLGELNLPGIGTAGLSTNEDRTEAYLSYESYNEPDSIYRVDLATPDAEPELWNRLDVPVDGSNLVVRRVNYSSKDGTEVGMFIVHRKGLELSGDNPTILYGYGGFDIAMRPRFSATMFPWFEAGGVYAVANLRGGGEKGLEWHRDGMLERKQNVFNDFIAAGEWLIANGYTRPERLGVAGGSNGGLLTGAVVTQRPDLFGAVISAVPLLDMLRYQDFLMARFWVPEYGSAENPEQFEFIKAYSPYHNVKPGTRYPATMITAGENDTRVHPMHARKMAALMQASTTADPAEDPILLWVDRDAGHGSGKPFELQVRDVVDQRIFMMWQLGLLPEG